MALRIGRLAGSSHDSISCGRQHVVYDEVWCRLGCVEPPRQIINLLDEITQLQNSDGPARDQGSYTAAIEISPGPPRLVYGGVLQVLKPYGRRKKGEDGTTTR